ncbi:MAG: DNA topoisomerase [Clostridia bacterium]|nr:DNA topoisomerase [Clostridia bacterium]
MLKVIIAEKPSVARNIAEAVSSKSKKDGYFEGPSYIVTWAFGHLLELLDSKEYDEKMTGWRLENYPFIPTEFLYKIKVDPMNRSQTEPGAEKQMNTIKSLIEREDVDGVISACDYDREGQIIGDIILEYLKVEKDVDRLLLNEWTADEVKNGLKKRISNKQMQPLRDAGISRQWADWAIGINLTSVATLKYQRGAGKALNIGRVLLPTLKIVYDRDKEIENFVSEEFHKLTGFFKTQEELEFEAAYVKGKEEKFTEKAPLEKIVQAIKGQKGMITDKQAEKKKEYPPSLFNLSNLQGYVTSKQKGWTSDKVLKVAQGLYEKKMITYPRTASMALEETLTSKAKRVLDVVKKGLPYENEVVFTDSKRVFDNKKVESHSAIIPTYILPKNLSPDEQVVYDAVKNRFVMQFMPVAEHEEAGIVTEFQGIEGQFVSKGRVQLIKGWKKVENIQSKDKVLPNVNIGDAVTLKKSKIDTKGTKPPKRHTEKTLLRVMETCGKKYKDDNSDEMIDAILSGFSIGTPATRAETINKLKSVGYIGTKGKSLFVTDMGRRMVECFPIKELFDLEYTGKLEKTLSEIGKGKYLKDDFLNTIYVFIEESVDRIKKDAFHVINTIESNQKDKVIESLGKCPVCGSDVIEGQKGFGCSNWRGGCKFIIWKNDKFLASLRVKITKDTVVNLLEHGRVLGRGLTSKKGNKFDAILSYEKNEDKEHFSWKMEFQ